MKSEFTREGADPPLNVGIMHVGAYDTDKQKINVQRRFLWAHFLFCQLVTNYWCNRNTNEGFGPGNLYGRTMYQEISLGMMDKAQTHKIDECFILHYNHF